MLEGAFTKAAEYILPPHMIVCTWLISLADQSYQVDVLLPEAYTGSTTEKNKASTTDVIYTPSKFHALI